MDWKSKWQKRNEEAAQEVREFLLVNGPSYTAEIHRNLNPEANRRRERLIYRAIKLGYESKIIGRMAVEQIDPDLGAWEHYLEFTKAVADPERRELIRGVYFAIQESGDDQPRPTLVQPIPVGVGKNWGEI